MSEKSSPRWWATPGGPDSHNYTVDATGAQRCHICDEVESLLRQPTSDEKTNRAAMHMVHGVRAHLDATAKEWES